MSDVFYDRPGGRSGSCPACGHAAQCPLRRENAALKTEIEQLRTELSVIASGDEPAAAKTAQDALCDIPYEQG